MTSKTPQPVLSLTDCVCIIVGLVIGAGIFRLPSLVAAVLPDQHAFLLVWVLGGLISVIGALCYAEMATAFPSAGGEYHFLTRAYGTNIGFMFAWARITVIQSGSIALFAYVFGDYAAMLLPLGPHSAAIYAVGAIIALTGLNLMGLRATTTVQRALFIATLIGAGVVILTGFLPVAPPVPASAAVATDLTWAGFSSAMLLVLLTFGGWNEAAYISAEVRDGARNMIRALLISIALITAIYVGVNYAYLQVLGVSGVANSTAVAADVLHAAFGDVGAAVISAIIIVVVLDNTNITLFTGARSIYALGRDFPALRILDRWDTVRGVPVAGVLVQGAVALVIALVAAYTRRGLETVVDFLQPVFWTFFLLTGLALFMLRRGAPDAPRPFRVPFYPVLPALFCIMAAAMLWSAVAFTGRGALVGVGVLLLGLPVLLILRRFPSPSLT